MNDTGNIDGISVFRIVSKNKNIKTKNYKYISSKTFVLIYYSNGQAQ